MDMKKPQQEHSGDLEVNNLVYKQPTSLSLATSRKMCRQYFQRNTYSSGNTAICEWNTGSSYINPHNSYLVFKAKTTGANASFGTGSALNFIESLTIRSRSGTELDRIDHLNLFAKTDIQYSYAEDWIGHFGTMVGLTNTAETADQVKFESATKFVIPLNLLSGFFQPTGDQLIPPHLASGLHLTFEFADHRDALKGADTITGYEITDISIQTDCTDLSDDAQKTLNMESAQSGLEYTYPRVFTSTQSFAGSDVNVQIRKAVSQATTATAVIRKTSAKRNVLVDSMASDLWAVDRFQFRLGSLYFPNQEIKDGVDGLESFFIANQTYDKCKTTRFYCDNAVNLTEFKANYGIMAVSLERDQELNLSGLPINNSRTLELNATIVKAAADVAERECVVFLKYMCVARAFIDNVAVSV